MKRLLTLATTTAGLLALGATPCLAAPAQHMHMDAAFDGYQHWSAEDNLCGPYDATFHEVRTGGYAILQTSGGQQPGEIHVNGAVDGHVEIVPDDPSLPTYTGDYREKVGGIYTSVAEEEGQDVARVAMFRLRVPLTGTDGSRLVLLLSGKETLKASGQVVVERFTTSCS